MKNSLQKTLKKTNVSYISTFAVGVFYATVSCSGKPVSRLLKFIDKKELQPKSRMNLALRECRLQGGVK